MSPPPAKRRRTSSPRPPLAGSPPPRPTPRPPSSPPVQHRNGRKKDPLDGFNDEEDSGEEGVGVTGTGSTRTSSDMDHQPQSHDDNDDAEEEEEHCAICLSPIENRVSSSPCVRGGNFANFGTLIPLQIAAGCRLAVSPRTILLGLHQGMDRPESQGESETLGYPLVSMTDRKPPNSPESNRLRTTAIQCPLCLGPIEHLIHNIRSAKDYQNHYLLPLHTVTATATSSEFVATFPPPPGAARGGSSLARSRTDAATINPTLPRHALYGRQSRHPSSRFSSSNRVDERDEATWREREQERALERRRYIYREGLYAKHVASNRYTGFKPFSPHTFSRNEELKAKVIKFIRREVRQASYSRVRSSETTWNSRHVLLRIRR
jgi:hypothetical protein